MKLKAIVAAAMIATASLGGCTSSGQIDFQKVIAVVQGSCNIIPTLASIVALFSADPAIATVEQAAMLICNGFKQSQTAQTRAAQEPRAGATVTFPVTTPNNKVVEVSAQIVS
jgi:hypothetical protein